MGSPSLAPATGTYVGNGSATRRDFACGFVPQRVAVHSISGEVVWQSQMPGPWKQVHTGAPTFLPAATLQPQEKKANGDTLLGFSLESADGTLNTNAQTYYWTAY